MTAKPKAGRPKIYTVQATTRLSPNVVKQATDLAALMPKMSVNEYYSQCIQAINEMVLASEPIVPRLVVALRAIREVEKKG